VTGVLGWAAASALAIAALVLVRRHTARTRWRLFRRHTGRRAKRPIIAWERLPDARWPVIVIVGGAFAAGFAVGGPVAAVVLAAYGGTGAVLLRRSIQRRSVDRARRDAVDAVTTLAGDLRAGLAIGRALGEVEPVLERATQAGADAALVATRIGAGVRVAEATGAPLADVLERLDIHLRAVDRARAVASAQAAGARASAVLLALMPAAGLGLGTIIGIDPLHVLLRTPVGAAALLAAVALQLTGLRWAGYLARVVVAA
jgi:tight adherence protein B